MSLAEIAAVDAARRHAKHDLIAQGYHTVKAIKIAAKTIEVRLEQYKNHEIEEQELMEGVMQDMFAIFHEVGIEQLFVKTMIVELAKIKLQEAKSGQGNSG